MKLIFVVFDRINFVSKLIKLIIKNMNNYGKGQSMLFKNLRTNNNLLPLISRSQSNTPHSIQKQYQNFMKNSFHINNPCSKAKDLIQTRLDKLNYQKTLLRNASCSSLPYSRDMRILYNMDNFNKHRVNANPNLYSYQFMDPIYFPMEIPLAGEPVSYPHVEIGTPLSNCCNECSCGHSHGMGLTEIMTLLSALGKLDIHPRQPLPQIPPIIRIEEPRCRTPTPTPTPTPPRKRKPTPIPTPSVKSTKTPIPIYKDLDDGKDKGIKRDWWKLAKEFIHVYMFFSFAMKYSRQAKIRNSLLAQRSKDIVNDISKIKEWIISIEQTFWEEFKIFEDLDVSFKNIDSTIKIQEKSQIIIAIIKKYMENLISRTSKMNEIPQEIQKVFYKYIKNKSYFPKQYLTTFQVNRLEFDVFGATQRITDPQAGMILAFLVICGVSVQQILLHMKDIFPDFRHFPNITLTAKYIGSIMHYLTRDTFQNDPEMIKELLVLLNYYRNYHLFNEQVEKQRDAFNNDAEFRDADEFEEYLIPEESITKFWELNKQFINTYKNFIYAWAVKLAGLIRRKYKKTIERDEGDKKKMNRPKNRKVEYYLPNDD